MIYAMTVENNATLDMIGAKPDTICARRDEDNATLDMISAKAAEISSNHDMIHAKQGEND